VTIVLRELFFAKKITRTQKYFKRIFRNIFQENREVWQK